MSPFILFKNFWQEKQSFPYTQKHKWKEKHFSTDIKKYSVFLFIKWEKKLLGQIFLLYFSSCQTCCECEFLLSMSVNNFFLRLKSKCWIYVGISILILFQTIWEDFVWATYVWSNKTRKENFGQKIRKSSRW